MNARKHTHIHTHTLRSPNVHENTHTHTHRDGHVGPLAPSTNWMPLLTNGLLKPHLQCTISFSSPLYTPRTVCVSRRVCAHVCVYVRGGGQSLLTSAAASVRSLRVVSLKGFCDGHIQFSSTFKHWRHRNVNKWFQWVRRRVPSVLLCFCFLHSHDLSLKVFLNSCFMHFLTFLSN